MSELAFDFAEGLVVGLGIKGEEKALLLKKWTEFSSNSVTYMVRAKHFLKQPQRCIAQNAVIGRDVEVD